MRVEEIVAASLLIGSMRSIGKISSIKYRYYFYYPRFRRYYYEWKLVNLSQRAASPSFIKKLKYFDYTIDLKGEVPGLNNITPEILSILFAETGQIIDNSPSIRMKLVDTEIWKKKRDFDSMGLYCLIFPESGYYRFEFRREDVKDRLYKILNQYTPIGSYQGIGKKNGNLAIQVTNSKYLDLVRKLIPEWFVIDTSMLDVEPRTFYQHSPLCLYGITEEDFDICKDFGCSIISFDGIKGSDYLIEYTSQDYVEKKLKEIVYGR